MCAAREVDNPGSDDAMFDIKRADAPEQIVVGLRVAEFTHSIFWVGIPAAYDTPAEKRVRREGPVASLHDGYLTIQWDGNGDSTIHDWKQLIRHDARIGGIRRHALGITISQLYQ